MDLLDYDPKSVIDILDINCYYIPLYDISPYYVLCLDVLSYPITL